MAYRHALKKVTYSLAENKLPIRCVSTSVPLSKRWLFSKVMNEYIFCTVNTLLGGF